MSTKSIVVAVLTVLASTRSGWSLHKDSPAVPVRVTSGAVHTLPDTRSWGRYLVFLSNQDLGETGSTGTQIFRYSHRDYLCLHADTLTLTPTLQADCAAVPPPDHAIIPVTTGSCAPQNPVISDNFDVVKPDQTVESQQVVLFDASGTCGGNDNGLVGAARNFRQIFSKNLTTGVTTPITTFTDGNSTRPAINKTGKVVAFESTASVNGFQTNGVKQVYLLEVSKNRFWNFPKGAIESTQPILNRSGDTLAFQTKAALKTDGHNTGVSQIFWVDLDFSKNNSQPYVLHQMTDGDGDSTDAYMASGGKFIVFQSKATNLNGQVHVPGLSASTQIFSGVTDTAPSADLPLLTQLTRDDVNGRCTDPAIVDPETGHPDNRDGARYTFACDGDPLQNGTTGKRAFVLDIDPGGNTLFQINRSGDTTGRVAGNVGVWFIGVSTTEDMSGTGICGSQIHMVDYFTGKWASATQIGQQPVPPAPGNPNASCEDNHACTTDTCNSGNVCSHSAIQGCVENCPTGQNSECSDNEFCTIDKCVHFQCQLTDRPEHTPCNDANACTATDECLAGVCTGLDPKQCTVKGQCYDLGQCNPTTGVCTDPVKPLGTPCNDGDLCSQTDTCDAGVCKGGNKVVCTALDQCHNKGTCAPATGLCSNPTKANGTTCNDGDLCTQTDTCQAGACTGGSPVVCPAGPDACHIRTCDVGTGQCGDEHFNTCDDANPCTTDGICDNSTGCPPPITIPLCTTTTSTTLPTTTTTASATTSTTTSDSTSTSTTTHQPTTSTTLISANSCSGLVGVDAVLCRFDKERSPGSCAADVIPNGIQVRFTKARGLIERAGFSTKSKVVKRLVKKAGKMLKSAGPAITKASNGRAGTIGPDCSAGLKNFIDSTRIRLDSLTF